MKEQRATKLAAHAEAKGNAQFRVCSHCLKLVSVDNIHDKRTCPELRRVLEGERLLHLSLLSGMTRSERQRLRFAIGAQFAPESDFLQARETKYAEICKTTPLYLDSTDNISVWARFDDTLAWLLALPHIAPFLPEQTETMCSIWTNDGTPFHGRLSDRKCHSMLGRVYMPGGQLGRQDTVGLVSLHELNETKSTFNQMFKANKPFYESFNTMLGKKYGWKKHLALLVVDGCAMGHHKGIFCLFCLHFV